ncbi:hypothetical protein [Cyclobacterium qasimii]|uniref:Uncharacterized protein n=2 Tax=Cyclobacterium qasimii TaxID=1350429 RepID=S7V5C7_9BACT|nr:hypothetical protein [Cyclobacterium qasimii]EPR65330.1 hypothetical protein ADICYQ_5863 [Cyclobacterium qasimii M12-11B]GEO21876.1 hypothetical protein CQA01_24100 [Cyclobacterium qasimii]
MIRYILSLLLLTWAGIAQAHQPAISSIILAEKADHSWILQIRSPLTSFEYVVKQKYGESSFATAEAFQELVVDYLKENISIRFNGAENLVLQKGTVQLGHETNVFFQVEGVPEIVESIAVNNPSFAGINRNQSIFMVLKEGMTNNQFILNNENQHSADLQLEGSGFVSQESNLTFGLFQQSIIPSGYKLWISGIVLVLLAGFYLKQKRLLPVN